MPKKTTKPPKANGKRAVQGHPWTGKPSRQAKKPTKSQLSANVRDILHRTEIGTAEMAAKREGADLSSFAGLEIMVATEPTAKKPVETAPSDDEE